MSKNRPAVPIEIRREVLFEARHHCAVCCNGLPLEQAHVIPWSKSREHSVANLVALCANCHSRADSEKWGVPMLRKYKENPCIMARKSNAPEGTNAHLVQLLEILVKKEFEEMNKRSPELASSLGAYAGSPGNIQVISVKPTNSSKVVLKLPKVDAEKILAGFKNKDPLLAAFMDDFELLAVKELNDPANPTPEPSLTSARQTIHSILDQFREDARSNRDLGDRFERLICRYLELDPIYKDRFSNVWMWNEFPKKGNVGDVGIDIVAEERATREYCAIQCKFYLPEHTLSKEDIDSFFTAAGKSLFTSCMIVSTTDKWGKNAEQALLHQSKPVTRLRVQDLDASPIDWSMFDMRRLDRLRTRERKTPRDHQKSALGAVL